MDFGGSLPAWGLLAEPDLLLKLARIGQFAEPMRPKVVRLRR